MARRLIPVQIITAETSDTDGGVPKFTIQHLPHDEEYAEEITTEDVEEDPLPNQPLITIDASTFNEKDQNEEQQQHHEEGDEGSSSSFTIYQQDEQQSQDQDLTAQSIQQRNINKTKLFYCPNCGNCYGAAGSLKLHIRACLKQKETEAKALEARKCNICGKIYNSISYLKEHILRHSGKAPRKCPKCYRKFVDYDKLEAHLKSHESEVLINDDGSEEKKVIKEYNCSFCQKKFQVVFDSRYTKRRYACDECREKFTNEQNLKLHKESLEEKKDFHCERCGRKFIFEGFLQRHMPNCDGTIKRKRDRVF